MSIYDRRFSRIENLSKNQLIKECKNKNLKHTGTKGTLVDRLCDVYGDNHMASKGKCIAVNTVIYMFTFVVSYQSW